MAPFEEPVPPSAPTTLDVVPWGRGIARLGKAAGGARLLNRVALALSFAGLFVAGSLSLSYVLRLPVPCGIAGSGCNKVALSEGATWFGVPVAFLGFSAYALLAIGSAFRAFKGLGGTRRTGAALYVLSLASFLASAGLTVYSLGVVRATCPWCLASAAIMTALFLVLSRLVQIVRKGDTIPISRRADMTIAAALALASMGGIGAVAALMIENAKPPPPKVVKLTAAELIPAKPHALGPADAPVTLVEFADLSCIACRLRFSEVKAILAEHPDRLRLVFRHLPLYTSHPHSVFCAVVSEYAAMKGRFWEFVARVYEDDLSHPRAAPKYREMLNDVGLNDERAQEEMKPIAPALAKIVEDDYRFAIKIGLRETPSFFLLAEGQPTLQLPFEHVRSVLAKEPYRSLLASERP
jgi:protein-disulfide isomerase